MKQRDMMKNEAPKGASSHALNRLADAFADDILGLSDEEVLAEFTDSHGDPAKNAADMRALFEKTAGELGLNDLQYEGLIKVLARGWK